MAGARCHGGRLDHPARVEIAHATAFYDPLADAPGGHYVLPEGPRRFAQLRIDGVSSPRGVIAAPDAAAR